MGMISRRGIQHGERESIFSTILVNIVNPHLFTPIWPWNALGYCTQSTILSWPFVAICLVVCGLGIECLEDMGAFWSKGLGKREIGLKIFMRSWWVWTFLKEKNEIFQRENHKIQPNPHQLPTTPLPSNLPSFPSPQPKQTTPPPKPYINPSSAVDYLPTTTLFTQSQQRQKFTNPTSLPWQPSSPQLFL